MGILAKMGVFKLKSDFRPAGDQAQAIKKLVKGIKKNYHFQTLLGVTGSGKTYTIAQVLRHFAMPVLVIAPNKTLAAQLYREYKNFFPENSVNYFVSYYDYYQPEAYLPITDTYIDKEAMINEEIERLRHAAVVALLTRPDTIVVASVSCIYNLGVPLDYLESSLHLVINQPLTRGDLIGQLVKMQFSRTPDLLKRGFFRVRGEILEVMPASEKKIVYRIEIDQQRVKALTLVEALTRRIREKLKELVIFPPKHFISTEPQRVVAIREIENELRERLQYFKEQGLYLEAERLRRRTSYDLEMLNSLGYCHGVENYSRHLSGKLAGQPPDTLLSYFQAGRDRSFLTIIDESHITIPQLRGMYEGDRSRKEILVQYGWRLPSALDNRPLRFEEFQERVAQVIFTSATPATWEINHSEQIVEQIIRPTGLVDPPIEVKPVFDSRHQISQIDDLLEEIKQVGARGERVIVNVLTKKMAEDLFEFLIRKGVKANYLHSEIKTLERAKILTDFRSGQFDVLVGVNLLREGLDLPEVSLVAILDADREGFLRSSTSIIQTMGRAARNLRGKVILYADEMTGSIRQALEETERRRKLQLAYNQKHGIKPRSIQKKVEELIEIEKEPRPSGSVKS